LTRGNGKRGPRERRAALSEHVLSQDGGGKERPVQGGGKRKRKEKAAAEERKATMPEGRSSRRAGENRLPKKAIPLINSGGGKLSLLLPSENEKKLLLRGHL